MVCPAAPATLCQHTVSYCPASAGAARSGERDGLGLDSPSCSGSTTLSRLRVRRDVLPVPRSCCHLHRRRLRPRYRSPLHLRPRTCTAAAPCTWRAGRQGGVPAGSGPLACSATFAAFASQARSSSAVRCQRRDGCRRIDAAVASWHASQLRGSGCCRRGCPALSVRAGLSVAGFHTARYATGGRRPDRTALRRPAVLLGRDGRNRRRQWRGHQAKRKLAVTLRQPENHVTARASSLARLPSLPRTLLRRFMVIRKVVAGMMSLCWYR
jgi:hypothetical protein